MHGSRAAAAATMWPELRFRCGDCILAQGDAMSAVFLVRSGVVRLSSASRDGKEAILALVGPGGVFGESAFSGGHLGGPAATAQTDCAVSPVPVEALLDGGVVSAVVVGLAGRLADTTADLERLLHHDVRARVAGTVARLADRYGVRQDGHITIGFALTQRELASMVGTSRESVSRSLSTLAACGWVRTKPGVLEVIRLDEVRRVARDGA